ncbi:MAG: insulinase family protein [Phycisphaerales bacterium]
MNTPQMKRSPESSVDRIVSKGVLNLLILVLGLFVCLAPAGERMEDDPGVRRYGLRNGLEVVVYPSPPEIKTSIDTRNEIQLWLLVEAGTAEEQDHERGIAQVAAAYFRHGVGAFDDEDIGEMLGGDGRHDAPDPRARGVQVLFEHTLFTGRASTGDPDAIRALMSYYASVLDPSPAEISDERFEEHRAWLRGRVGEVAAPMMTARQRWLKRMFGDGTLANRLDLPELHEIDSLTPQDLRSFRERVYRASRSTLIIVGDHSGIDIDALIARSLGRIESREPGARSDVTEGLAGEPVIFEHEPGWDQHQAVLVWSEELIGEQASERSLRTYIIERLATELLRRRVERLGVAALGRNVEIGVDRFELGNSVKLMQCVIQREGTADESWKESMGVLIAECERLAAHGAGREEITQARGALLAAWHRDAEAWDAMGSRDKARDLFWLVKSERAMIGSRRWDTIATRMMSTISDAEINAKLRDMLDLDHARVLVSTGDRPDQPAQGQQELEQFVGQARAKQYAPLDPQWMQTLGGELLADQRKDGEVEHITQHAPSGTWGGTLSNGVRVWARNVGPDQRIELCATVHGPMFMDGSLSEAEIDAALLAWQEPSTEERDSGWLAVFQESNAIEVQARRVVGGARLSIEAPSENLQHAMDLLHALLDRPMINASAFEKWSKRDPLRLGDEDPLDRAFARLYNPEMLNREGVRVPIDDAQRALTRIVHHASIDIAMAGALDPAPALEQAGALFGMLNDRVPEPAAGATSPPHHAGTREQHAIVEGRSRELVIGVRGGSLQDLPALRAIILASFVLNDAIREEADSIGLEGTKIDAQVVMSDALRDRWALVIRIRGDDPERAEDAARAAMDRLASEGIDDARLRAAQDQLISSIDRYFHRAGYRSTRLSSLGVHQRSVEDLWGIREGYASVNTQQATEMFRWTNARADWFRVDVKPSAR